MEWVTTSTILEELRRDAASPSWRRLFERCRRPIIELGTRLGLTRVEAEDAAQETLLAFVESFRAGRYERERGPLHRWLFGIAHKHILRQRDRAARERRTGRAPDDSRFWGDVPGPEALRPAWEESWERESMRACLERARDECSSDAWQAFELVVVRQAPPHAAAEWLGIPVKAVYNAKHRILTRLRQLRAELDEPC